MAKQCSISICKERQVRFLRDRVKNRAIMVKLSQNWNYWVNIWAMVKGLGRLWPERRETVRDSQRTVSSSRALLYLRFCRWNFLTWCKRRLMGAVLQKTPQLGQAWDNDSPISNFQCPHKHFLQSPLEYKHAPLTVYLYHRWCSIQQSTSKPIIMILSINNNTNSPARIWLWPLPLVGC